MTASRDEYLLIEPSAEVATLSAAGLIPEGCRVLDLGCGLGDDSIFLAGARCLCVGVDQSAAKIAHARRVATGSGVGRRTKFVQADVRRLPRALLLKHWGAFDFVLDRLACSNLDTQRERQRLFKIVASLLTQGGLYCLVRGWDHGEGLTGKKVPLPRGLRPWFSPLSITACGLPKVFGDHISARSVLAGTYPAKLSNSSTARIYLLSRRPDTLLRRRRRGRAADDS